MAAVRKELWKKWVPSPLWHQLEITAVKHSWWYMTGRKYPFLLLKQLWGGSRVIETVMYPWKPGLVWQRSMSSFLRQTQWSEPDLSKRRLLSLFFSLLIHSHHHPHSHLPEDNYSDHRQTTSRLLTSPEVTGQMRGSSVWYIMIYNTWNPYAVIKVIYPELY